MNKFQTIFLLVSIVLITSISFTCASADHILTPGITHALVSQPVSVFGKTYPLQVENRTYDVYYGFNLTYATITNISLIPENVTMKINLKNVTETDAMWLNFPQDLISAENNNLILKVDGQEKKYEFATSEQSFVIGFMIPANVKAVEIQGSRMIPEFPISTIVMIVGFMSIIYLTKIRR